MLIKCKILKEKTKVTLWFSKMVKEEPRHILGILKLVDIGKKWVKLWLAQRKCISKVTKYFLQVNMTMYLILNHKNKVKLWNYLIMMDKVVYRLLKSFYISIKLIKIVLDRLCNTSKHILKICQSKIRNKYNKNRKKSNKKVQNTSQKHFQSPSARKIWMDSKKLFTKTMLY